jgi:putative membrane protein
MTIMRSMLGMTLAAAALLGGCNDNELNEHQVNPTGMGAPFSDAEAAQVLLTANMGEVMEAQAALPKLTDGNAMQFAQRMIDEHSAAITNEQQVFAQNGITPTASDASTMLMNDATANVQTLQTTSAVGDAYDLTYLCMQVRDHATVVSLIDIRASSLGNAAVLAEARAVRAAAQMHLSLAQQIVASISGVDVVSACAPYGGSI